MREYALEELKLCECDCERVRESVSVKLWSGRS